MGYFLFRWILSDRKPLESVQRVSPQTFHYTALIFFTVISRSLCQSVSPARRPKNQQEEDLHQEGRHEPHLQRGHDLLCSVRRPAGDTLECAAITPTDGTLIWVKCKDERD